MKRLFWLMGVVLVAAGWGAASPTLRTVVPAAPEVLLFSSPNDPTDIIPMVPLTPFCELTGSALSRENSGGLVVTRGDGLFRCALGRLEAKNREREGGLPAAPFAVDGEPYVPLEPLAVSLGGRATPGADRRVTVTLPGLARPLALPIRSMFGSPGPFDNHLTELYVINTDGSGLRRLSFTQMDENALSLSPDGATLLYARNSQLLLRRLDDPRERLLLGDDLRWFSGARFSPSGKQVAFAQRGVTGGNQVGVVNIDGSKQRLLAPGDSPCWSPDGRLIAYIAHGKNQYLGSGGTLCLLRADGSGRRALGTLCEAPAFSRDGTRICCTRIDKQRGTVLVVYTLAGKVAAPPKSPRARYQTPGLFLPGGQLLAFAAADGLYTCTPDRGGERRVLRRGGLSQPLTCSPDGRQVLLREAQGDGTRDCLLLVPIAGGTPRRLTIGNILATVGDALFLPDGQRILFTAATPGEE